MNRLHVAYNESEKSIWAEMWTDLENKIVFTGVIKYLPNKNDPNRAERLKQNGGFFIFSGEIVSMVNRRIKATPLNIEMMKKKIEEFEKSRSDLSGTKD